MRAKGALWLFDNMFDNASVLQKGLDASWLKNKVIANNIANVDTPGFKSSSVSFESVFKNALKQGELKARKTRSKHVDFSGQGLSAIVQRDTGTVFRSDGNNVNIDFENAELAKNTIYYNALVQQLSSELRKLSMVIKEGG